MYRPLGQGSHVPWAARHGEADQVAAGPMQSYRVQPGDQLGLLAERFGVSLTALAAANDLGPPYLIRVGEVLRIPPGAQPPESTMVAGRERPSTSRAISAVELPPRRSEAVAAALEKPKTESRMQVAALDLAPLRAPPSDPPPPAVAGPTPELKPVKAAALTETPATDRYTVRPGDTLSAIARRLGVGTSELAAANGIKAPYRVYTGQKLNIPGGNGAYRTTVVDLGNEEPREVRLATGKPPPLQGDGFLWPVNGKVVGKYGPIDQWRRRDGIDIAAPRGAPVLAAQDGIVAYAGNGIRGYGEMILLRHDQDYITTYAHNASLLVEVGDIVRRGQVIARVGDSGDATRTMLHFELRKGRQPIDPETLLVHDDKAFASVE